METKRKKIAKPLPRKIHINGQVWTYRIGRGGARIHSPNCGLIAYAGAGELTGITDSYYLEKARWKRYLHITPGMIKEYIIDNLMSRFEKGKKKHG